jgi:hypothetical protein
MTREAEDRVSVPLGLVAHLWIRMFKQLVKADLPHTPTNRGMDGLGLIRDSLRAFDSVVHLDLRIRRH